MQQRQLRLGDILDDYCPRERRITNHAVVAMIEEEVRQTRCTTCDAEHVYKQARIPPQRRRKTESSDALSAGGPPSAGTRVVRTPPPQAEAIAADRGLVPAPTPTPEPASEIALAAAGGAVDEVADGPVHRQLIRATLPRPEGHVTARPAPEFTMRQATGRSRFGQPAGRGAERHRGPHSAAGAPRHAGARPHARTLSTRPSRQTMTARPGKKRSK
jgi:hypothetical protein